MEKKAWRGGLNVSHWLFLGVGGERKEGSQCFLPLRFSVLMREIILCN